MLVYGQKAKAFDFKTVFSDRLLYIVYEYVYCRYMTVCMRACMLACMKECMYACVHGVCMNACTHACMCVLLCTHVWRSQSPTPETKNDASTPEHLAKAGSVYREHLQYLQSLKNSLETPQPSGRGLCSPNPKPQTLNPNPEKPQNFTLDPEPLNPKP